MNQPNQRTKRSELEAIASIIGCSVMSTNVTGEAEWQVQCHGKTLFKGTKRECLTYLQGAQFGKTTLTETTE